MQSVGFPSIAWIPPYVAQVPAATTAHALGASRSIHSHVVIGCPVPFRLVLLIWNRAFDDQDERRKPSLGRFPEVSYELIAVFIRQERIVKVDFRNPGKSAEYNIFDARLRSGGGSNRIAVTPKARREP